MFSKNEQKAIQEKIVQLKAIKDGLMNTTDLAESITQRRVDWFLENKSILLEKYKDLSPQEQAHRIICFDHMKIIPD